MKTDLIDLWVYLSTSPLLWLTVTVCAYVVGDWIYMRSGRNMLANPFIFSVVSIIIILKVSQTPYRQYFEGAQFVHFMLGPATVALAIPLYKQVCDLREHWRAIMSSVLIGATVAAVSAMTVAAVLGASKSTVMTLGPKSVTTPIAMGISDKIGGEAALTAVLVVLTGIFGALVARPLLNMFGIRDPRARGLAMGVVAHGIGTAAAFDEGPRTGAFSGMAMALAGIFTAILLPLAVRIVL